MSFVWVGMGFMTFFAASTLAIDVGMYMTARSQAQNAADAGALAGATALVFNDYDDRSAGGPVVRSAITTAESNLVIGNTVSVQTGDVTFPLGPAGLDNRVQVNVFRTTNRNNPVATIIGPIFGVNTVDIGATATAEASPANAVDVRKPFTIPDRWTENTIPAWTTDTLSTDTTTTAICFPMRTSTSPRASLDTRGYSADADKGLSLLIRAGTGNNIAPCSTGRGPCRATRRSALTGGDRYRDNIAQLQQDADALWRGNDAGARQQSWAHQPGHR